MATGHLPEKDALGKDKWPWDEEKVWREGEFTTFFYIFSHDRNKKKKKDLDQVTRC